MAKPEPTWAQKAQNCKAELDGCNDQLERFQGMEHELTRVRQELEQRVNSSPDLAGLSRQIEFWKREATTAQQREASLQGRVQQLENALRQAPTRELVDTISTRLAETEQERRQAAQQAAECTNKAAGMVQRLQQFQSATEALGAMEQAADQWQRKATAVAQENAELRRQNAVIPALERKLSQVTEERDNLRVRDQRHTDLIRSYEAEVHRLTPLQSDLVQKATALEAVQRELHEVRRQRDQAEAEARQLRSTLNDLRGRLG